jgi:hypothetical protein
MADAMMLEWIHSSHFPYRVLELETESIFFNVRPQAHIDPMLIPELRVLKILERMRRKDRH